MNYYLPRYDLPLVLGYTGPGLSFYSSGSEKINNLIPSFSKQEDLLTKSRDLENQISKHNNDLINTFFSDKVAMLRATLENILSQVEERKRIKGLFKVALLAALPGLQRSGKISYNTKERSSFTSLGVFGF